MQNRKILARLLAATFVSLASVAAVSVQAADAPGNTSAPAATSAAPAVPGTGGAASASVDDATITSMVKVALVEDKQVQASKINVTTEKGIVAVSGIVPSIDVGNRALQLAASVQGVKGVKNELKLKGAG